MTIRSLLGPALGIAVEIGYTLLIILAGALISAGIFYI